MPAVSSGPIVEVQIDGKWVTFAQQYPPGKLSEEEYMAKLQKLTDRPLRYAPEPK